MRLVVSNWEMRRSTGKVVCAQTCGHTHTHLYTVTVRRIMNVAWDRNFFLNNQPDALTIPILFCYKSLHVSGIFSAHHQEFSSVHSALVSFRQSQDGTQFHPDSAWKRSSKPCMKLTSAECTVENS
jgi:hypothetical protein